MYSFFIFSKALSTVHQGSHSNDKAPEKSGEHFWIDLHHELNISAFLKALQDPEKVDSLKNSNLDNNFGLALKTMLDAQSLQDALSNDDFYDGTSYDEYLSYF